MADKVKSMLVGVVSLVIGGMLGAGYGSLQTDEVTQQLTAVTQERDQAIQGADRLRRMPEEAVKKYATELGKLIVSVPEADDPKLMDTARALLATRDSLRASLDGARAAMNSEFDGLAVELGNAAPNPAGVKQLLENIKQNWPAREKAIDDASRKLLVDLGLLRPAPAPKPEAAPEPAPAPAPAAAPAEKK